MYIMPFRVFLCSAILFFAPVAFAYAGGLIPECPLSGCRACDLVSLANNVVKFLVEMSVIIAVISFVTIGFKSVTSGESGAHELSATFSNIVIGIIIMLVAWLVVDTVLKFLVSSDFQLGPWHSIQCIDNPTPTAPVDTGDGKGAVPVSLLDLANAPLGKGDCSPDGIAAAAKEGGYALTPAQANTFSCLAQPESGCSSNPGVATTPDGRPTTASGVFQVVMGYADTCHSLNIPVCTDAANRAGYGISGNLNCSSAFDGGKPKPGMETLSNACKAASSNFACNTSAAACLMQQRGGFSDWTADARSGAQRSCIGRYNI